MLVNALHVLVAVAFLDACALHSAEEVCEGTSCAEEALMSQFSLIQRQFTEPQPLHESEGKAAEELNPPAPAMTDMTGPGGASDVPKETSSAWDESVAKAIKEFDQAHPGEFDDDFFKGIQGKRLGEAPQRLPTKAELNAMMKIVSAAHEKMMEGQGVPHAKELMDAMMAPLLNMSQTIMQFDKANPGQFDDEFSKMVKKTGLGETPPRPPTKEEMESLMSLFSTAHGKRAEGPGHGGGAGHTHAAGDTTHSSGNPLMDIMQMFMILFMMFR